MIRLFTSNETNFNHNKWILNECTNAIVTENISGIFNLDLEYPMEDTKNLSQYLVKGNIIKCPISATDARGEQLFIIRTRTINTKSKRITVFAECIARYDLSERNFILGVEVPQGKTRKEATQILLGGCVEQKGEFVGTLDTNTNTNINLGLDEDTGTIIDYLDIAYVKPLEGLLGSSQSIQVAYGGEIIFNNKEINFVDERGSDNTFIITDGKNLEELQQEITDIDGENFATALIMCSSDGIYLPNNEILYSSNAPTLGNYYKKVICSNISAVNPSVEALDVVYAQLREAGQKLFNDGLGQLKINNTINFIQLKNTEEYKNYAVLEKCELGNSVTVNYTKSNITADGRITEIKFNPLWNDGLGKIEEITIGEKKKTITDTITSSTLTIADTVATLGNAKATLRNHGNKITAVVESNDGGMSWELNQDAFVVACVGASNSNVTINADGLEVNNGKFILTNASGKTVFKVNTSGKCTAVKGFVVEDGDNDGECCKITTEGLLLTNNNGYTGKLNAHSEHTALQMSDDLYIEKDLRIKQGLTVTGYISSNSYGYFGLDLDVAGELTVGGDSLIDIIDARIAAHG